MFMASLIALVAIAAAAATACVISLRSGLARADSAIDSILATLPAPASTVSRHGTQVDLPVFPDFVPSDPDFVTNAAVRDVARVELPPTAADVDADATTSTPVTASARQGRSTPNV